VTPTAQNARFVLKEAPTIGWGCQGETLVKNHDRNHKLENKIYPKGGGACKASGQTVILKILDLIDNGTYAVSALLRELRISEASLSSISAS